MSSSIERLRVLWEEEQDLEAGTDVQLLDGHHRALAAIMLGESHIPVVVGENYRGDVRDDEWLMSW